MSKICVVGLGYIGIPTCVMFASKGYDVVGVDIREEVVKAINNKELPIEEKGLSDLFNKHPFRASLCMEKADVYIICVGTPTDSDHKVDLKAVKSAANDILPYLRSNNLVILESTVPPGTTNDVVQPILEKSKLKAGMDFHLVHSPERVIPGNMIEELSSNDRIMGGVSKNGAVLAKQLYSSFVTANIYLTDAKTAETSKLMENTFRNVNIAFANEVSRICEKLQINAWEVINLANKHPRVNILEPGPGVGGHCIPVDPWFIVEKAKDQAKLIELALTRNQEMPLFTVNKIKNILKNKNAKKICLLGCTFKSNTDDVRESPTFEIEKLLKESGYEVILHDPNVEIYNNQTIYEACNGCDIAVLLVTHSVFHNIDYEKLSTLMKNCIILDTKNFIDSVTVTQFGFDYYLLGDGSL